MFDLHPEKFLVPSNKAWHKVQATFSKTNPTQMQKPMKRKLHQDSENDTDDDNNDFVMVPNVMEEQKLGCNPPHLVLLFERVIVCSGCEIPFNHKDCKEPNNMVFKYMMFQTRPNGRGKMVQNNYHRAGYFHA